jgi:NADPH-dependent 2,4-dienoyl-CoA reductase/sulfur reductase-like enzyme
MRGGLVRLRRVDERGLLLEYGTLILCCGARELLLPFPGWTLPGVTGAGGLQALIKSGLDVRGQRTVIAGSGPLLLASAATARHAGAQVLRVLEQAAWQDVAARAGAGRDVADRGGERRLTSGRMASTTGR